MSINTSFDKPLGYSLARNNQINVPFFEESDYGPISNIVNNPHLKVKDTSVVEIGDDFTITGKELKRSLKVLAKIIEKDYPEELI